jgi:ethanolamine ammonia-lyase large subunit
MAVAGNADPMLGYLTTSFDDHRRLREHTGRQITSPMQRRLALLAATDAAALYARYARAGGDRRSSETLEHEGRLKIGELQERGFDLGLSRQSSEARLERIYQHARRALYATIDDSVIRDVSPAAVRVRTAASSRDDFLAHPANGERLRDEDATTLWRLSALRAPQVQIVIADGLNADAINEQLRGLLPAVRRLLTDAGCRASDTDIVVQNGRVRAGYQIGGIIEAEAIVHIIGERPGTGLNTASAYLTYGRDGSGRFRWDPRLDHSCTSAVCGIHAQGKPPQVAAAEIARSVARMLEERRSGVIRPT